MTSEIRGSVNLAEEKTSNKKKKISDLVYILLIFTIFFTSFSISAFIYLKSENLVFSDNAEDIKELASQLSKKDKEISKLENQLERYKSLYEDALYASSVIEYPDEKNLTICE